MIVDFEQDPNAPYGTGNFRDETGKITYLHDPDTASLFSKTMKGSSLGSQVGSQSTDIARNAMGAAAPATQPDARLALNDSGAPVPVGDLSASAPNMSVAPAPNMSVSDAPNMSVAPPATPAQMVDTVSRATGTTPPATPQSKPQQFINAINKVTSPRPAPVGADLPVAGVTTQSNSSVVRGRKGANVDRDVSELDKAGGALDTSLLDQGREKDTALSNAFDIQQKGLDARREREDQRITQAQADRAKAMAEKAKVEEALKKNDESLDPDNYLRNMSTGKQIGMAILAALNGAFGATIGQHENGVIDVMNKYRDTDIQRQKDEIASGRIRMGNLINQYMQEGHDAHTAELLARDRLDNVIDQAFELQAKRTAAEGENLRQAQMLVAQRQEQRSAQRRELLAQKEDRVQEASSRVVEQKVPSPKSDLDTALKEVQLQTARLKLGNDVTANLNAEELSKQIYGVNEKGQPNRTLNPDEVKELKAKADELGKALAETAGAVNMTKALAEAFGGKLDETTGHITWPASGDLKGAGIIDRAGGYAGVLPPTAPFVQAGRALGVYRADIDRARDAQRAIKEYVTKDLTGANSNLRQDATFTTMVGGELTNEDQVRENVQNWADTLFATINKHKSRLGPEGQRLVELNERAARQGNQAPPLNPRVPPSARGTTVIPENDEPTMSVNP